MTSNRGWTKSEYRDQWEAARLEVEDLIYRATKVAAFLDANYIGTLGEEPPDREEVLGRHYGRRAAS